MITGFSVKRVFVSEGGPAGVSVSVDYHANGGYYLLVLNVEISYESGQWCKCWFTVTSHKDAKLACVEIDISDAQNLLGCVLDPTFPEPLQSDSLFLILREIRGKVDNSVMRDIIAGLISR
jgi:hypothetical protein